MGMQDRRAFKHAVLCFMRIVKLSGSFKRKHGLAAVVVCLHPC